MASSFLLRFIESAQRDERLRVPPANQEREPPLPVSGRYSKGFSHSASIIHPWSLHSNGVPHATGLAADGGRTILTVLVPHQLSAHWMSWSSLYGDSETELNFFFLLNKALSSFISPYYICVTSLSAACYVCASTELNDARVAITLLSKWTKCLNQSPSPCLRHLCCYSPPLPINVWLWWLPLDLSVTQSVPCEGNNPPPS